MVSDAGCGPFQVDEASIPLYFHNDSGAAKDRDGEQDTNKKT